MLSWFLLWLFPEQMTNWGLGYRVFVILQPMVILLNLMPAGGWLIFGIMEAMVTITSLIIVWKAPKLVYFNPNGRR